jgi:hypothetical protein
MNERIKKLAQLATQQYSPTYYTQEWIEGFAKLIVLECADLVEGFEMTQQFAPDVIMNFEASSVLKEQFGVEE